MMFSIRGLRRLCAIVASASALSACAGSQFAPVVSSAPKSSDARSAATIRLVIAHPSMKTIAHRAYVSASTQSLVLTVTTIDGAAPAPAIAPIALNVVPGSAPCPTPASGQALTCTFTAILPIGSVGMTATTYDAVQTSAQPPVGSALSTASLTQVLTGTGDSIGFTLGGVASRLTLNASTSQIPIGTASTIDITATAFDADDNVILGSTPFAAPATLSVTDPLKRLSFTQATLSSNASTATLAYDGASGFQPATIAGTLATGTVAPLTLAFVPGLTKSIQLPTNSDATQMTLSPDGKTIYASLSSSTSISTPSSIQAVNLATSAVTSIPMAPTSGSSDVLTSLYNSSISSDGKTLYTVAGMDENNANVDSYLEEISTATDKIASTIALGKNTFAIYVSTIPNTSNLAISDNEGYFDIFSTTANTVTTQDPQSYCYPGAACLAISSDGSTAYSAQNNSYGGATPSYAEGVNVFSLKTGAMTGSYDTDSMPYALLLSKDGSLLYVSEFGAGGYSEVQIFSTATGQLTTTYPLAAATSTLALTPDSTMMASESSSNSPPQIFNPATGAVISMIPIAFGSNGSATYDYHSPIFGSDGHTLYYLVSTPDGSTLSLNQYAY